jgi:hypothetical protein
MMAFGIFSAAVYFIDVLNGIFAKYLDVLAYPVLLIYGALFGGNDAYLLIYLIACILYFAGIGFLLGRFSYLILSKTKKRNLRKSHFGHINGGDHL